MVDEVLFQSVPTDVGITVIEITVPFAAVFAAELLRFSARDGVERMSFPDRHGGRRLRSEARGAAVGLQQGMGESGVRVGQETTKKTKQNMCNRLGIYLARPPRPLQSLPPACPRSTERGAQPKKASPRRARRGAAAAPRSDRRFPR